MPTCASGECRTRPRSQLPRLAPDVNGRRLVVPPVYATKGSRAGRDAPRGRLRSVPEVLLTWAARGQDHRRRQHVLPAPGGRALATARDRARVPARPARGSNSGLAEHHPRLLPGPERPAPDGAGRLPRWGRGELDHSGARRRRAQALSGQAQGRGDELPDADRDADRRDPFRLGRRRGDPDLGLHDRRPSQPRRAPSSPAGRLELAASPQARDAHRSHRLARRARTLHGDRDPQGAGVQATRAAGLRDPRRPWPVRPRGRELAGVVVGFPLRLDLLLPRGVPRAGDPSQRVARARRPEPLDPAPLHAGGSRDAAGVAGLCLRPGGNRDRGGAASQLQRRNVHRDDDPQRRRRLRLPVSDDAARSAGGGSWCPRRRTHMLAVRERASA